MKHVAIVIGHGPKVDKGAESQDGKVNELEWNTDLAARIRMALTGRLRVTVVKRVTERLQPLAQTNDTGADAAVELHLNSFNGKASGTEMIAVSERGRRLGQRLQDAAVRVLGLPDRGVKGPQGGGRGSRWLNGTRMPAVIVESFFVDNPGDLKVATERKEELARAYADALVQAIA